MRRELLQADRRRQNEVGEPYEHANVRKAKYVLMA
jgi:hypothetical protein